jgi:hypothetical protein
MKSVVLALLLITLSSSVEGQVVLNEILANEPGGSTSLEWVEIYNVDTLTVNLEKWKFVEGNDTTELSNQVTIPAKGYLILARKLLSAPGDIISFEGKWGNASGIWGDSPEESFPAVEAKMSLTNGGGSVSLIPPGNQTTTFTWYNDPGDGISWEKVDYTLGDDTANWRACTLPEGSTPGKVNSVALAGNDLALEEFNASPQNPAVGEEIGFDITVKNVGSKDSAPNLLTFFDDLNFNLSFDSAETSVDADIGALSPGAAHFQTIRIILPEGNHRLVAVIGPDDKIYSNQKTLDLKVGSGLSAIIINEIMAAPDLNKDQTEWVELYNGSQSMVSLQNWKLGDAKKQTEITTDVLEIQPGGFTVVAEDKNKFLVTYPGFGGVIIQQESWQTLDNDGDEVILKDSLAFLAEKVSFSAQNLKGISWERVDFNRSASDSDNWWRSVDSSGATPGRENSVHSGFSSSIEIVIRPNPFSPDDDGFDDQTEIEYKIPLGVDLTMQIYDRKGRLVRTLMENQPSVSGKITWDGKKDDGNRVRSGIYVLLVEAEGEAREVKKETIAVVKER